MGTAQRFKARNGIDNQGFTGTNFSDPQNPQDAATANYVQNAVNGYIAVPITSVAQVLTAAQAAAQVISYTGVLTANTTVAVPAAMKSFTAVNNTSGNFTLTQIAVGGTGVAITQGKSQNFFCDGTNVNVAGTDVASVGLMASVAPGTVGNVLTSNGAVWVSTSPSSNPIIWTYSNNNVTAVANGAYDIDTSLAPLSLTLPANPSPNTVVMYRDYANKFPTNNLTIITNGSPFMGTAATTVTVSNFIPSMSLTYIDATQGWSIT